MLSGENCLRALIVAFTCGRKNRLRVVVVAFTLVLAVQVMLVGFEASDGIWTIKYPYVRHKITKNTIKTFREEGSLRNLRNYSENVILLNGKAVSLKILDRNKDNIIISFKKKQFNETGEMNKRSKQITNKHVRQTEQNNTPAAIPVSKGINNTLKHQPQESLTNGQNFDIEVSNQHKSTEKPTTAELQNGEYAQEKITGTEVIQSCPNKTLYSANRLDVAYGTCEPHKPTLAACKLAHELYVKNPAMRQCVLDQLTGDICRIEVSEKIDKNGQGFYVYCDKNICSGANTEFSKYFGIKTLDTNSGELKTERFESINDLERGLALAVNKSLKENSSFVFVQCSREDGELISQLLPIDPRLTIQKSNSRRDTRLLNVNIVLLDSVARAHFYRSLPKTIKKFQSWVDHPSSAPATVLDFELFQAVDGHTAENTHALFTGTFIRPNSSGSVEMEVMFKHYKSAGYQTTWQEDLCFKGVWGLMLDLKALDWTDMQRLYKEAGIDQTGLTFSSCEILKKYNLETPFNGPEEGQICYNGRFQHTYFTSYLKETVSAIEQSKYAKPSLFYMALNVGHDYTGRRIQTLDDDLADFVDELAHKNNTLTFLLADHGNTYADYTSSILEGSFEMYHPSLFIIIPHNVARLMGDRAMHAMKVNQRRLVTVFDLHDSLMDLARPIANEVKPVGIFTPIPSDRTCNDIKLKVPNRCVCEGWDSPTSNDSLKIAIAEFAVGEMNDMIEDQFEKAQKKRENGQLKSCERIQPLRFENVRERNSKTDGALITSMNIVVKAGKDVKQVEDIFYVEVKSQELPNQISLEMKLLNFERITLYGRYKTCADNGVSLKLCICSTKTALSEARQSSFALYESSRFLETSLRCKSVWRSCLLLCKRNHDEGKSFGMEIANFCSDRFFFVKIALKKIENIKLSRSCPFKIYVPPNSVRFAISGRKDIEYWNSLFVTRTKILRTYMKTLK